jgi:replication-associated recombination protein RarA
MPSASRESLPNTLTLIDQATGYLQRAASLGHNLPLLLTGAKGTGKTSVAKLIASRLEADRDTLTGKFSAYPPIQAAYTMKRYCTMTLGE